MFTSLHIMNKEGIKIKDTQSFMYQLTINAPMEKGWTHKHILDVLRGNFKTLVYVCMADEQGSCFHTHIFVVFASRVRFSMVKRYFEEAHIEKCKGSVSDNVNYVKKTGKWELDESKQEKKIEGTFAMALLGEPELLILDEPTNGLDPIGIEELRKLIRSFPEQGITVILSSHILSEVQLLADKVGIISGGILGYEGALKQGDNLEDLFMNVVRKNQKAGEIHG